VREKPLYIAAYDICDAHRLRLALQVLKGYATGGQKSVFECFLSEAERSSLVHQMASIIAAEDRYFMVRLDPRSRVLTLGIAVPPADPPFFYVA
jgi:CRISPR-associated protein Cas2